MTKALESKPNPTVQQKLLSLTIQGMLRPLPELAKTAAGHRSPATGLIPKMDQKVRYWWVLQMRSLKKSCGTVMPSAAFQGLHSRWIMPGSHMNN